MRHRTYRPKTDPDLGAIVKALDMMERAKKPLLYTGGGIVNAGPGRARLLRELAAFTGFPVTSTLMGLGAFPASHPQWLGLCGMRGTYESNMAMHDCDLMVCLGARFRRRVTGAVDKFSPGSRKIHLDIDPSQINKNIRVDLPIIADAAKALKEMVHFWKSQRRKAMTLDAWWAEIAGWRAKDSLAFRNSDALIKPQYAIDRLFALTRGRDIYITTEVGQHQMWAAQHFHFEGPNRWLTSGGLGTMGYGLPASIGVQMAHPDALVIDIGGEASVQMTMQEMSTAVQYDLPVKIFIINNRYMGMVRQWQQLLHGGRYSHSYSEALPDFRQARRRLRLRRPARRDPGRARRQDHGDDRHAKARAVRLPRRSERKLLPDDPIGRRARPDDPERCRACRAGQRSREDAGVTKAIERHTIRGARGQRAGRARSRRGHVLGPRL